MIEVRYDRGVYLPIYDLWLDPWEAKRFAFVSHAHSDHIAPHKEIILSERTARLRVSRDSDPVAESRDRPAVNHTVIPAATTKTATMSTTTANECSYSSKKMPLFHGKTKLKPSPRKNDPMITRTDHIMRNIVIMMIANLRSAGLCEGLWSR